jgi:hypothetical protein
MNNFFLNKIEYINHYLYYDKNHKHICVFIIKNNNNNNNNNNMVKVLSIIVFDSNLDEKYASYNLKDFNYFYRNKIQFAIKDGSKLCAYDILPLKLIIVECEGILPEKYKYNFNCFSTEFITIVIVSEKQYPEKCIKYLINILCNKEFDGNIEELLKLAQSPLELEKKVDKIGKIQNELNEIMDIMKLNMETVIQRGENLEILNEKAEELNIIATKFGKEAKNLNKCCKLL